MTKSIHRDEYQVFLAMLKERRDQAGLTQKECSEALGKSQSFISDVERGVRRLDLLQLRDLCGVLKITLAEFVTDFEAQIGPVKKRQRAR